MNKRELISFEEEVKSAYLRGEIRAPIHLSCGSEDALITLFKDVKPGDWIVTTHRSHYHALLKGIKPTWLMAEIMDRRSMHIMADRFVSSSIVGGGIPIAIGLALGIKLRKETNKVWCFVGDMAARTGTFLEGTRYAANHDLPIIFVVEDNSFSVNTPTSEVWGEDKPLDIQTYTYKRVYPHAGAGEWVKF